MEINIFRDKPNYDPFLQNFHQHFTSYSILINYKAVPHSSS